MLKDINFNYFHFTKIKNIESIQKKGLLPKISFHAQALEKTKKIFFVEGLDNLLILFDCWIHVCSVYPLIPGLFNLGTIVMKYKYFPKILIKGYFKYTKINKIHKVVAYNYFDRFLRTHTLLNLDIIEGLDFDYNDIDEIKSKGYDKEYLILGGYNPKYSDLESNRMNKWNLHTFTNKTISPDKIKLCSINKSSNLIDILNYALKYSNLDLKEICPELYVYLNSRNMIK